MMDIMPNVDGIEFNRACINYNVIDIDSAAVIVIVYVTLSLSVFRFLLHCNLMNDF